DLVILDLHLPAKSGIDFLKWLKQEPYPPLVLVVSGQSDISTALQAVKLGAIDYLEKPVHPEKLLSSARAALMLASANRQRHLMVGDIDQNSQIVGNSKAIKKLLKTVQQVAPTDTTVLITGENGTGKELVATRIFLESKRRDKPFVRVNCPGIPSTLFESELFGHTKGAFTGAVKDYPGKFVLADGGTIFLDEIGDLTPDCQAKLLRVLETGEVETLGSIQKRHVDVRVICATNKNLQQLVTEGRFREDLYYRISVFIISVPPLRERRDDIPLLIGAFLKRFDPAQSTRLSPEALAYLTTLDYPGNVRQLKNIIERLTILFSRKKVELDDLLQQVGPLHPVGYRPDKSLSLSEKLAVFEKHLIEKTLSNTDGNVSEAARLLRTDRANLSKKIKELKLKNN
ncbi:MAG: sigma-54-dependent transcriptional regulator, partial [Candidatus Zixiibacteriota bacterium]